MDGDGNQMCHLIVVIHPTGTFDPDEAGGGIGAQKSVFHGHVGEVGGSEDDMNYVAGGGEVGVGVDAGRISPGDLFVGDFMEAVVGQASSRFFANVELPSNYYVSLPKLRRSVAERLEEVWSQGQDPARDGEDFSQFGVDAGENGACVDFGVEHLGLMNMVHASVPGGKASRGSDRGRARGWSVGSMHKSGRRLVSSGSLSCGLAGL